MSESEPLTKDEVFEILSNSRRRQILHHLHQHDDQASLQALARSTASGETEGELTDDKVKRFYISLYQTHIPKLEESGLVQYDRDSQEVVLTARVEELGRVLGEQPNPPRPWPAYYALLAIIGLLAGVGILLTPHLLPPGVEEYVPVLLSGLLLLIALLHYREVRRKATDRSYFEHIVKPT